IGANCAVDRAKFGITRIGAGTKIDNLVQVAHNVQIGPHCLIVAQVGIAGSTQLGTGVVLGGQVGVRDHIVINDGVRAAACCCITKDIPAGTTINGIPAIDNQRYLREQAQVRQLPRLADQVKALMKRVEQLEATADDS
ncbi:MAG: UDP-3-O-(3-hydroxymyristoyl)glucosamine N-acyltransferase, partial [Planctomycetota bacterium]